MHAVYMYVAILPIIIIIVGLLSCHLPKHLNFCTGCHSDCDEGQRRCIGGDANQCCNWYLEDECVISCPSSLVGDMESGRYDCSEH